MVEASFELWDNFLKRAERDLYRDEYGGLAWALGKTFENHWEVFEQDPDLDPLEIDVLHCRLVNDYETLQKKFPNQLRPLRFFDRRDYYCFAPPSRNLEKAFKELEKYISTTYPDQLHPNDNLSERQLSLFLYKEFGKNVVAYFRDSLPSREKSGFLSLAKKDFFEMKRKLGRDHPLYVLTFDDFEKFVWQTHQRFKQSSTPLAQSIVVAVGDSEASLGLNSEGTVRLAKTNLDKPSETLVLTSRMLGETGRIDLDFEDLNWTAKTERDLLAAASVFVVPFSYEGPIPPTLKDKADWFEGRWYRNIREGGLRGMNVEVYFAEVVPVKRENPYHQTVFVSPEIDYSVNIQAATKWDPKNKTAPRKNDPYDNMKVTVTTSHFDIAPDVSKPIESTIILGDEFDNVVRWNGHQFVALEDAKPVTANTVDAAVPRLLPRAYAKYHPRVRSLKASNVTDQRTFSVTVGKNYLFRADISGLDDQYNLSFLQTQSGMDDRYRFAGRLIPPKQSKDFPWVVEHSEKSPTARDIGIMSQIRLSQGEEKGTVVFTQNRVYYMDGEKEILREVYEPKRCRWLQPVPEQKNKFWVLSDAKVLNDYEVMIEERVPDETFSNPKKVTWKYYQVEVDARGNWFVSEWAKEQKEAPFLLVKKTRMEDEFDARQIILAHQAGSHKNIQFPFTAKSRELLVEFVSYSADGKHCDELRFDRVQVEEK